jgi:DTW domain-containing protein YfiP
MIHFNYEQWTREHDRQMAQHAHEMALLDAQWNEARRIAKGWQ